MMVLIRIACLLYRLPGIFIIFAGAAADHWIFPANRVTIGGRCLWLQRWSRMSLKLFGATVRFEGPIPDEGILAANHLSYVDILVLASIVPQVFVAKKDVAGWPLFGSFARFAGTLFIDRKKRSDVVRQAAEFRPIVRGGYLLTLFLEGTSSGGESVLPFRSSLIEPAAQEGWPVVPVALHYECIYGEPAKVICYWGEMTLGPHLLKLISIPSFEARVAFGGPVSCHNGRKAATSELQRRVSDLKMALVAGLSVDSLIEVPGNGTPRETECREEKSRKGGGLPTCPP